MLSITETVQIVSCSCAVLALIISIWAKLASRSHAEIVEIREDQAALRKEQDDEKGRLVRIEAMLDQAPKADAVYALGLSISKIDGDLRVIQAQLTPMAQVTLRLQDWLIENGK